MAFPCMLHCYRATEIIATISKDLKRDKLQTAANILRNQNQAEGLK